MKKSLPVKQNTEEFIEQFKGMLRIDREALDDEIERHADLYFKVQEAYSRSVGVRDAAKTSVEETWAQCAVSARKAMVKSQDKWTESQIKDEVSLDVDYLEAVAAYRDTDLECRMLDALARAFEQKGRMLRELAGLYVSGYFTLSATKGAKNETVEANADAGRKALSAQRKPVMRRDSRD